MNDSLCPSLKLILNSTASTSETVIFLCFEALKKHVKRVKRQYIEELSLLAANGPTNREAAFEIIEILEPEIVRRWPLLGCGFRNEYRKLSY